MSVEVKNGDRVRVVLEGPVTRETPGTFTVGDSWNSNVIFPDAVHVKSVEVLRRAFKVGDTVETIADLRALPMGTVVKPTEPDYVAAEKAYDNVWYWANGSDGKHDGPPELPATILYLPEGDQ